MEKDQYEKLKAEILAEAKAAFQAALKEAVSEVAKCAAQVMGSPDAGKVCNDRCGLNPNEHYEAHKRIDEFFSDLSDVTRTIRSTFIKILVTVGLIAGALGLGIEVKKYLP